MTNTYQKARTFICRISTTVSLDGSVPDDEILRMIDHAYEVVVAKYPKYI